MKSIVTGYCGQVECGPSQNPGTAVAGTVQNNLVFLNSGNTKRFKVRRSIEVSGDWHAWTKIDLAQGTSVPSEKRVDYDSQWTVRVKCVIWIS